MLSITSVLAQEFPTKKPFKIPAKKNKPLQTKETKTVHLDSLKETNSSKKDTIKKNRSSFDIITTQKAEDYIKINRKENKMYLYNKAKITYGDIDVEAGLIIIDLDKEEIYATGIKDSLGRLTQRPVFTQDGSVSTHDEMRVNFKTKKALLHNSVSEMDGNKELKYILEYAKKENDSVIFAKDARITTSDSIYDPEYYIHIHKMKLIPNKKIIAGYSRLVIENVPTPLGVPFAFFPITNTQTSGILMPVWGDDSRYGYFLQNGGYYFAISDYMDLTLQGTIYMNGSYGAKMSTNYKKRYRYGGKFSIDYSNMITSERGLPNYLVSKLYHINWNHSPDRKASPNASFSASVDYSSSQFYRDNADISYNPQQLNNTSTSSITYSRAFVGTPFNLTASTRVSQNFNTELITSNLPSLRVSMQRIFPLTKLIKKKNILSALNIDYNFDAKNSVNTPEEYFLKTGMMKKAKTSVVQSSKISTNFTALKHLRFGLNSSYKEVWHLQTLKKTWNNTTNEVEKDTIHAFKSFRTYNFSENMNTTFYGLFRFKETSKIQAIRHSVTPNIGFTTAPKFDQYYDRYQASIDPNDIKDYTPFEYIGNRPSNNESRILTFSINNDFEAKINKKDSINPDAKAEKRKLLSNFNFSTSYDMVRDSLKWSDLSIGGNIHVLKDLTLNLRSSYSFYAKDASGRDVNISNKKAGGSWLRFKTMSISTSYSLSNNKRNNNSKSKFSLGDNKNTKTKETEKYYNFNIPWTMSLNYGITMRDTGVSSHGVSFSGTVDLTPKWHIRYNSGYDFKGKGFTNTHFNIDRDLDSWTMNFGWTPKGYRNTWSFFIGIKSSVLSDIKWDKRGP